MQLEELVTRIACVDCSRFLATIVAGGFLFLAADSFLEHYFTQKEMRPYQWVPVIFGLLAFPIAALMALRPNIVTSRALGTISLLSLLVGGWGFYFHVSALWLMIDVPFEWSFLASALRYGPPILAPLSYAGLGVLGLVAAFAPSKLLNLLSKALWGKDFAAMSPTRSS